MKNMQPQILIMRKMYMPSTKNRIVNFFLVNKFSFHSLKFALLGLLILRGIVSGFTQTTTTTTYPPSVSPFIPPAGITRFGVVVVPVGEVLVIILLVVAVAVVHLARPC